MQNAADAGAMAGGRALDQLQTGVSTDVTSVYNAARNQAQTDGANVGAVGSRTSRAALRLQPDHRSRRVPDLDRGHDPVERGGRQGRGHADGATFFAQVAGVSNYTANSDAMSLIGKPTGGNGPFLICANALGAVPNILINQGTDADPVWVVNPEAVWGELQHLGQRHQAAGPRLCDPASNFRGLIDQSGGPYSIPGWWGTDNGNKNGPTLRMISSGNYCDANYVVGCRVVLPLCVKGNGAPGNSFEVYCVDLGLFQITNSSNNDIRGDFLGRATITQGGIGGEADPNGSRIVQLVE